MLTSGWLDETSNNIHKNESQLKSFKNNTIKLPVKV